MNEVNANPISISFLRVRNKKSDGWTRNVAKRFRDRMQNT